MDKEVLSAIVDILEIHTSSLDILRAYQEEITTWAKEIENRLNKLENVKHSPVYKQQPLSEITIGNGAD